jgi:hypothetical protein
MDYTINRYVRERLDRTEIVRAYSTSFVFARARNTVEMHVAERVEIIDEDNVVVFRWPRVARAKSA